MCLESIKYGPAVHKHALESIIERFKREGCKIAFSNQGIDDLLGLQQPACCSREEREEYKFARKHWLDNIKRDLLYNHNLRFTVQRKPRKAMAVGAFVSAEIEKRVEMISEKMNNRYHATTVAADDHLIRCMTISDRAVRLQPEDSTIYRQNGHRNYLR